MADKILPQTPGRGGSAPPRPTQSLSSLGLPEIQAKVEIAKQWNRLGAALGDVSEAMFSHATREQRKFNMHKARTAFNKDREHLSSFRSQQEMLKGEQAIGVGGSDAAVDGEDNTLSVAQRVRKELNRRRDEGMSSLENDAQREIYSTLYDDYMVSQINWADKHTRQQFAMVEQQEIEAKIAYDISSIGDHRGDEDMLKQTLADITADTKALWNMKGFPKNVPLEVKMNLTRAHRQVVHSLLYEDDDPMGAEKYLKDHGNFIEGNVRSELSRKIEMQTYKLEARDVANEISLQRDKEGKPLPLSEQIDLMKKKNLNPDVESLVRSRLTSDAAQREADILRKRERDVYTIQGQMRGLLTDIDGDAAVRAMIDTLEHPKDQEVLRKYWEGLVKRHNEAESKARKDRIAARDDAIKMEKYVAWKSDRKRQEETRVQALAKKKKEAEEKAKARASNAALLKAMEAIDEGEDPRQVDLIYNSQLTDKDLDKFQNYAAQGGAVADLKMNDIKSKYELLSGIKVDEDPEQFIATWEFVKKRLKPGKDISDADIVKLVETSLMEGYYGKPWSTFFAEEHTLAEAALSGRMGEFYIPIDDDEEMDQWKAEMGKRGIDYKTDDDVVAFKNYVMKLLARPTRKAPRKTPADYLVQSGFEASRGQ